MKFSTGIILSALAFNAFAATPTNISPGPILDRRDAEPTMTDQLWKRNGDDDTKPTMTDPLWKRNGDDDAEGSVPSSLRSDAGASGGRSRSGRGGDRSRSSSGSRSPSRSRRLPDLITLNALVVRVYDEHKPIWTEDRRKEVLAFGQKPSVAAGNKVRRKIRGEAGTAMGKEIEMLLQQSLRFTNILVIINIRADGPFQIPEKLLEEVVSKMPEREKSRMKVGFVEKLESIIARSREHAKSHRSLLEATAKTISGGTKDIALALKKALDNAQDWAANIDTLVKTDFKDFLASISKNPNSVSKAIEIAQKYVNDVQVYTSLLEKHYDKFVLMIRDPTKAKQLEERVEEVPQRTTPLTRKGGVKGRPSSI
ncbi:hypothetical protein BASA50_004511 [Batrachochytrium salamandrivorans]|uniref:Uncharacterized protein n=1 Tax=Batrachochytrium salamandrivorans TaxID=1357716 RepID=A0ABQ8FFD9_9FUNG|nr:hypothetical protein BASA50_004511 [Batrachochytrium salamandrivorans]KAH9276244.1 hypothetical protein BASA83_001519 [Batrachochytrium salamandrivorans]